MLTQILPLEVARTHHAAFAINTDDLGDGAEAAEHQGNAAVLTQMGGGLVAAAGYIEVGDGARVKDAEGVHALGRKVRLVPLPARLR